MNDVKKKLKELASKQEIHDLQDNILKSVDTSKVVVEKPVVSPIRRKAFISNILVSASIATACVLLGVGIGYAAKNNKPTNGRRGENPSSHLPEESGSKDIPSDKTSDIEIIDESNIEVFKKYFDAAFTQDTYNIINVANSLNTISFDKVILSDDKSMTVSEETALVNDLSGYIHNIEDMLGITSKVICTKTTNNNTSYDYEEVINVDTPYVDYYVYLTEIGIEEKNIGEVNYKTKSSIEGLITYDSFSYEYNGIKVYKNSATTFNISLQTVDYKASMEEIYKLDLNEFRYAYTDLEDNLLKNINVKQKLDENGNTVEIQYDNTNTEIVIKVKNQKDDNTIYCEIKGRNSDSLTITKTETGYNYHFKNSDNSYTK